MSPLVVTVPEAGRLLGVSKETARRWVETGILPELTRTSRRRLVPRQAVEQLVAQAMDGWDPAAAAAQIREQNAAGRTGKTGGEPLSTQEDR